MLFTTAVALNDPFGYDPHDLKLNELCANLSLSVLDSYSMAKLNLDQVVRADRETPDWLERELPTKRRYRKGRKLHWMTLIRGVLRSIKASITKKDVLLPLSAFTVWITFLLFLSWRVSRNNEFDSTCRWWCIYVPVESSTTAYVGLGVFLLIGFWLLDAYDRYWRGLQIWQSQIRSGLETIANNFAITCKQGLWHPRDRERIFAHLAALPYAAKLDFRGIRDTTEIKNILSTQDCTAMTESHFLSNHCFDVLYGYFHSAETRCKRDGENTLSFMMCSIERALWEVEFMSWGACLMIREHPLPPSFTLHLSVFTNIWLAILPLAHFQHYGFLSFLFLVPIGYSIITLLSLGRDLTNPFEAGEHDVPLDVLCNEIRDSIHSIYEASKNGPGELVQESEYRQSSFHPKFWKFEHLLESPAPKEPIDGKEGSSAPTLRRSVRHIVGYLPSVPWQAQLLATLWAVAAVFFSYGLSFAWEKERRDACKRWCSPIDVDASVLLETGFALFFILSFRASDAIQRYEDGAMLIFDIDMHLRALAVEIVQAFENECWHKFDKERIIAHMVQLPLVFRDALLGTETSLQEGILSDADRLKLTKSRSHTQHCLRVLETYLLTASATDPMNNAMKSDFQSPVLCSHTMLWRISQLRELIARVFGMKRFPVIRSYTRHQRLFTALWLILLPLGMVPDTGFYTILWAPLISYAVLGLEEIAVRLMDPFGLDSIDLPLKKMCKEAARRVLQAAHSVGWTCEYHLRDSDREKVTGDFGCGSEGTEFGPGDCIDPHDFENSKLLLPGTRQVIDTTSFYTHMLKSVPWWVMIGTVAWTILAVALSYVSRTKNTGRWWETTITIDGKVGSYVSIPGT